MQKPSLAFDLLALVTLVAMTDISGVFTLMLLANSPALQEASRLWLVMTCPLTALGMLWTTDLLFGAVDPLLGDTSAK